MYTYYSTAHDSVITGPPNWLVLFCSLASVILPVGGPGVWAVSRHWAGLVGGQAATKFKIPDHAGCLQLRKTWDFLNSGKLREI